MIRFKRIGSAMAGVIRLFSFALLVPIVIALLYDERDQTLPGGIDIPASIWVFIASAALATLVWVVLHVVTKRVQDDDLLDREGFITVGVGWLVVTALGMAPFLLSGAILHPVDAFFESMSGLTGTSSSVLALDGSVAPSILFWRAFMQWLGGLAFIVLMVALLSKLTHGGIQLFQSEASGHSAQRIRPKLAETAKTLWVLYLAVSSVFVAVLFFLLARGGMAVSDAFFDALVHAMSAFATGGFSTHVDSVAAFGDPWIEAAIVVMMMSGGTNFTLMFLLLRKAEWRPLVKNPEWRFYLAAFALGVAGVTALLTRVGQPSGAAMRDAAFTVASFYTGTGFTTAPLIVWPQTALFALTLFMLMGGMAGSTSSAIKSFRWLLLTKIVGRELRRIQHPRAVIPVRLGRRIVGEETVSAVIAFFFTYLTLWVIGLFALMLLEPRLDAFASAGLAASALGNVGGGYGVHATGGYAGLAMASKVVLSALMWLGRLELFTALLLLYPSSWKN